MNKKKLQKKRRIASLLKKYNLEDYRFYQEKEVSVFVNNQFYKKYRNISVMSKDLNVDRSTLSKNITLGKWIIKQRRRHPFTVGDIVTFE